MVLLVSCLVSSALLATPHSYMTVYGDPPKYPEGFEHFDYVNPDAPKGGSLRRSAKSIDRFNFLLPYLDKGTGVDQINA